MESFLVSPKTCNSFSGFLSPLVVIATHLQSGITTVILKSVVFFTRICFFMLCCISSKKSTFIRLNKIEVSNNN